MLPTRPEESARRASHSASSFVAERRRLFAASPLARFCSESMTWKPREERLQQHGRACPSQIRRQSGQMPEVDLERWQLPAGETEMLDAAGEAGQATSVTKDLGGKVSCSQLDLGW